MPSEDGFHSFGEVQDTLSVLGFKTRWLNDETQKRQALVQIALVKPKHFCVIGPGPDGRGRYVYGIGQEPVAYPDAGFKERNRLSLEVVP